MAGETALGVATLQMTAGVDEGPVADERPVEVPPDADAGEAYRRLAPVAVASLLATLDGMEDGSVRWRPQEGAVSYAAKVTADDRRIDWTRPATAIADQVRALSPHIGTVTDLLGRRTFVWRARAGEGPLPPSSHDMLVIPAGDGWIEVLELQQEGRRRASPPFGRSCACTAATPGSTTPAPRFPSSTASTIATADWRPSSSPVR